MSVDPSGGPGRGIGVLLRDLAEGSADLVRGEVRLARIEIGAAAGAAGKGTAYIATGGVLILLGVLAAFTGIVLLVGDQWLPRDLYWLAALLVALIAGGIAAWLLMRGRSALSPSALAPHGGDAQGGRRMAETTADVRKDIELTRTRISETLQELEQKMNVTQIVKSNPWAALAVAVGAGVLLSGSRADVKAATATVVATKGASSRIGSVLDEIVAQVVAGFQSAIEHRIEGLANDVKHAIGAPTTTRSRSTVVETPSDQSIPGLAARAD